MKKSNQNKWEWMLILILLLVPFFALIGKDTLVKEYKINDYMVTETFYLKKNYYYIIITDQEIKIPLYYKHDRNLGREVKSINKKSNCYIIKTKSYRRRICLNNEHLSVEKPVQTNTDYLKVANIKINKQINQKILWWDYKHLNIIDGKNIKKIKLVKDDYNFKTAYLKDDLFIYMPVNINTIDIINVININAAKLKAVEIPYLLSSNIRYLGHENNNIYLLDEDNLQGYVFNPKREELTPIKGDINIFNNGWHSFAPGYIIDNNIKFNVSDQRIFNRDVFKTAVINDGVYGKCFLYKDSIYQLMPRVKMPILRYNGAKISHLECIEGIIYFVEGNRFRKIDGNYLVTIAQAEELFYNKNKIIFIEK